MAPSFMGSPAGTIHVEPFTEAPKGVQAELF